MNLTEHFTLEELLASDYALRHGIDNNPADPDVLENLHVLANGLERVKAALDGLPVMVNSGYRSPKVNAGVGGSKTSAHLRGLAADIVVPGMTPREVCIALSDADWIGFDQVIFEGTWTHVAFAEVDEKPRGKVLTAVFRKGQPTYYVEGIA